MDRLERLKKPIEDMTPEELREHVAGVRKDRVMAKRSRAETKKTAVRKDDGNRKLRKLLEGMTEQEREAFLKELEDEGSGSQD